MGSTSAFDTLIIWQLYYTKCMSRRKLHQVVVNIFVALSFILIAFQAFTVKDRAGILADAFALAE